MARSKPPSPYDAVAELLNLDPVDPAVPLTPEDFGEMLEELERGLRRATSLRREIERIKHDAMLREG